MRRDSGTSDWKELDAVGVSNLARLTGALSLLPSALFTCISVKSAGPTSIVHRIAHADGSEERLPRNNFATCFNRKTSLHAATAATASHTFKPDASPGCHRWVTCQTTIREVPLGIEDELGLLPDGDPFPSLQRSLCGPRGSIAVCMDCLDMLQEHSTRERRTFGHSFLKV